MKDNFNIQLVGQKVILVPYHRYFVETYHRWMKDPYLQETTGSEPMTLEEEIKGQQSWCDDPFKLTFIVLDKEHEGSATGAVEAMAGDVNLIIDKVEPTNAEVCVMIAEPSCRRRGLAQAAVELAMWYGRSKRGLTHFTAKISESNEPSLKLFEEKLGFKRASFADCFKEHTLERTLDGPIERPQEFISARPFSAPVIPSKDDTAGSGAADTEGITEEKPGVAGASIERSSPRVKLRYFGDVVGDGVVEVAFRGQLMLLSGCCTVNLTADSAQLPHQGALVVGMGSKFEPMPLTSALLGDADELAKAVAQHLAKRTKLQCFVTASLPENATSFVAEITACVHNAVRAAMDTE